MIVDFVDQLCRHQTGGEMLRFWQRDDLTPEVDNFIIKRVGMEYTELKEIIHTLKKNSAAPDSSSKVGRFRLSGEPHQWMYDSCSLKDLLHECGFKKVIQRTALTSSIDNFSDYNLDTDSNGKIRKPDSFYIEAFEADN